VDDYGVPITIPAIDTMDAEQLQPGLYFGTIPETVRDMPVDYWNAGWTLAKSESGPLPSSDQSSSSTFQPEIEEKLSPWPEKEPPPPIDHPKQGCQCTIM
jgi:hypothetical protein